MALAVLGLLLTGLIGGLRPFGRSFSRQDLALDRLREISLAGRRLEEDVHGAREVIYPVPGGPSCRLLYFRDHEGRICAWYFSLDRRELRKATFDLAGLPIEARPVSDVDDVYLSHDVNGLLSWGIFSGDLALLGSVKGGNP